MYWYPADTDTFYWIGLSDDDQEGTFVWIDGTIATYEDWKNENGDTEPSDRDHTENCVVIHSGGWADITCQNRATFICEL